MTKYIAKRIIMIIPIILCVTLILFFLISLLAGANIGQMPIYGGGDSLDSVFSFFNASENLFTRYIRYCYNLFVHFDFGISKTSGLKLMREIPYRVRNTVLLLACSVGITLIVGIPLGVYAAVRKNRWGDRLVNVISLLFSSIPSYSLAFVIALLFAVYLRLVPVISTYKSPVAFFMPTLTVSLGGIASIARMTRTSMLEVLGQPYIEALRSKGLKEADVVYRHALKNALIPIASALGGLISQLLCGTFVVEHFFNLPGLGSYILRSVSSRDHFEVLGCTVILTIMLAITNIATDIIYMFINPQIKRRYSQPSGGRLRKGAAE